ncbi:ABC transporter permease [Hungatella hathewayi]|uniref:ABC transporter permease n=1 Tax=Hungatella hathewayi TaxID=154046 RepID=UPI00189E2455|nr:ABC transporter permease [Hungatella hathewayi]
MENKRQSTKGIEKKFEVIRVFVAVCIALVIAFVLISIVSSSPAEALRQFLIGPLMSGRNFGNVIELTIPLIFSGLAVCVMFQCNQFNMGAEGAFFFGGLAASYVAATFILPAGIHPVIAIFAGGAVGIVICLIPALLKVKWGANEVVSSLMLNYIVLYLGTYILQYVMLDAGAGYSASGQFEKTAKLPVIIPKTRVHTGLFLALALVIITYLLIYKSKWGYAIRMTGKNSMFAKYSGIGVGGAIVLSQVIGGAVAGMGGAVEILGMYTRFSWTSLPGYGFDGIIIAILAKNNPLFVPFAALFLAYLRIGADIMSRRTDVAPEVVSIVQSLIILLVGAKLFLEHYKHKKIVENSTLQSGQEV